MRILAVLDEPGALRHLAPLLAGLGKREHELTLLAAQPADRAAGPGDHLEEALRRGEEAGTARWSAALREPRRRVPGAARAPGTGRVLARALPVDREIRRQVSDAAPDLLLACPFPAGSSAGAEYLRAARRLGIATAGLSGEWHGLRERAMPVVPDAILVWNDALAAEAAKRHAVGPERFAVTGAARFDTYFKAKRRSSRESFCVQVGADHRRALLLHAGSAPGVAEGERALVEGLAAALRERPETAEAQLLVRPHPAAPHALDGLEAPNVLMWPPAALGFPDTQALRKLLVQALLHSAAVTGVHPGVFLEAAVFDRPCIGLAGGRGAGTGRPLRRLAVVEDAADPAEAVGALVRILAHDDDGSERRRSFVEEFLRPFPEGTTAANVTLKALEAVAAGAIAQPWRPRLERVAAPPPHPERARAAASAPAEAENGGGTAPAALGEELEHLRLVRRASLVTVDQPLVLISQVQRSGGTLLGQLFDSHPQCHAHPGELHIGYPQLKENWPPLDPADDPDTWYGMLEERHTEKMFREGYAKSARGKRLFYEGEERQRYPFLLPPSLQRDLFDHCVGTREIASARDILDCYMTAYFNAWLDNRNLLGDKRWVTGFAARLGIGEENRERFFADYPDGRLISCIREPKSWFASARTYHDGRYGDIERSMRLWSWSAASMLEAKERFAGRVHIVSFESLVTDVEAMMRAIAEFLEIEFTETLVTPTFNGHPMKANSSFPVAEYGMLSAPAERRRELEPDASDYIERNGAELYERVISLAG